VSEVLYGSLTASTDELDQISETCKCANQSQSNRDHNGDVETRENFDLFLPAAQARILLLNWNMRYCGSWAGFFDALGSGQNVVNRVCAGNFT
jgi:hypothetical protein